MNRDMDLVRKNMLGCVNTPEGERMSELPKIDGFSDETVGYHIHLMGEAGLLKVADVQTLSSIGPEAVIASVTWKGHDFADSAAHSAVWEYTKGALKKSGAAGIDITIQIMKAYTMNKLKEIGLVVAG